MLDKANIQIVQHPHDAVEIHSFATDAELNRFNKTSVLAHPHIRPNSVCVIAIGNNWEPGCWQKVMEMIKHTNKSGVCCWFAEVPDRCVEMPYHSLPSMRDCACLYAHDLGVENVLLIENDILPEPDLVLRLMNWNHPVIVPLIKDEKLNKNICDPQYEPNTGLQPVTWAVLSCILISCRVLNCFPDCMPFGTQNIEGGFFLKLAHYGHKCWQDTDTILKVATRPTYPGTRDSFKKLMHFWKQADIRRRQKPNRKPIDSKDKRDIYWPEGWIVKDEPEDKEKTLIEPNTRFLCTQCGCMFTTRAALDEHKTTHDEKVGNER